MIFLYMSLVDDEVSKIKIEEIYNNYKNQMFYAAYKILNDRSLAEDAVHDAFLGIAKNISKLNSFEPKRLRSYVITCARHAALMYLRKSANYELVDINSLHHLADENGINKLNELETVDFATSIIKKLPAKYSETMYLHFVLGLSAKEIAAQLSQNTNTVRQHISRGRKLFIDIMKKGEQNEEN